MILIFLSIFAIVYFLCFPAILEICAWTVYGGLIPEKELDAYLDKYLLYYQINSYSKDGNLLHLDGKPYISKMGLINLSTWYIKDHGRVPRWSKWSKRIQKYRNEIYKKQPKKSLYNQL